MTQKKYKVRALPDDRKVRRYLINAARRIFFYYYRPVCLQKFNLADTAGSGKGHWVCKYCKRDLYHSEDVKIDHIEPVMDTEVSEESWAVYYERLFIPPEETQPMCKACHNDKTQFERERRNKHA